MHGRLWCPGVYGSRYQHSRGWTFERLVPAGMATPSHTGNHQVIMRDQRYGPILIVSIECGGGVAAAAAAAFGLGERTDCYRLTPILRCDMCDIRYRTVVLILLLRSRKGHTRSSLPGPPPRGQFYCEFISTSFQDLFLDRQQHGGFSDTAIGFLRQRFRHLERQINQRQKDTVSINDRSVFVDYRIVQGSYFGILPRISRFPVQPSGERSTVCSARILPPLSTRAYFEDTIWKQITIAARAVLPFARPPQLDPNNRRPLAARMRSRLFKSTRVSLSFFSIPSTWKGSRIYVPVV